MLVDVKIDAPVRETTRGELTVTEFTTQNGFAPPWDLHANAQLHYTSGAVKEISTWIPTVEGLPAVPPVPSQYVNVPLKTAFAKYVITG